MTYENTTLDSILIEQLKVETVIGCLNWERQILQPLLLDLEIFCDLQRAGESDRLEDTLNYAEICEISSRTIQQAQPELIEHAGYLVVAALFETYPAVQKIRIHIRKPAIIPQAQAVGICLIRTRDDFCTRIR